jgi:hypothetical protein
MAKKTRENADQPVTLDVGCNNTTTSKISSKMGTWTPPHGNFWNLQDLGDPIFRSSHITRESRIFTSDILINHNQSIDCWQILADAKTSPKESAASVASALEPLEASIRAHHGKDQGYCDDLESMGYVPWGAMWKLTRKGAFASSAHGMLTQCDAVCTGIINILETTAKDLKGWSHHDYLKVSEASTTVSTVIISYNQAIVNYIYI